MPAQETRSRENDDGSSSSSRHSTEMKEAPCEAQLDRMTTAFDINVGR